MVAARYNRHPGHGSATAPATGCCETIRPAQSIVIEQFVGPVDRGIEAIIEQLTKWKISDEVEGACVRLWIMVGELRNGSGIRQLRIVTGSMHGQESRKIERVVVR